MAGFCCRNVDYAGGGGPIPTLLGVAGTHACSNAVAAPRTPDQTRADQTRADQTRARAGTTATVKDIFLSSKGWQIPKTLATISGAAAIPR